MAEQTNRIWTGSSFKKLPDVDRMYGRIPESLQKNPDFKKFMKKAGPVLSKGYGKEGYKGATLTQGGKFGDSYTTPPSEEAKNLINSKSLVRQGKKIGAKTSANMVSKALRGSGKVALKGLGAVFGTPAIIAADLLDSKVAGTDQFGRALDTVDGFEAAKRDDKVADYFLTYGTFPEGTDLDSFNRDAVNSRITGKLRSEHMAQQLRQVNRGMEFMRGNNPTQPTPEEQERQRFRYDVMRQVEPTWSSEIKQRKMVGPSQGVQRQVARTSREASRES